MTDLMSHGVALDWYVDMRECEEKKKKNSAFLVLSLYVGITKKTHTCSTWPLPVALESVGKV